MRFKTVADVLHWVEGFHRQVQAELTGKWAETGDERIRMLLAYLADHEQRLTAALEAYEEDAPATILFTWYRNADCPLAMDHDALSEAVSDMDIDEVLACVVRCHNSLIELYETLRDRAEVPSVAEIFASLAAMEASELRRSVRDTNLLKDL